MFQAFGLIHCLRLFFLRIITCLHLLTAACFLSFFPPLGIQELARKISNTYYIILFCNFSYYNFTSIASSGFHPFISPSLLRTSGTNWVKKVFYKGLECNIIGKIVIIKGEQCDEFLNIIILFHKIIVQYPWFVLS